MQPENILKACLTLPSPVLTVYLNALESDPSRHPRKRSDLVWLRKQAEAMTRGLSPRDAKQFERQVNRVRRLLLERYNLAASFVIFAGPRTWMLLPLQVRVRETLHWGKPKVDQLLSLLNAHRFYGVVVLDHKGVRYFRFRQGQLGLLAARQFDIDPSQWKRKDQGHVSSERIRKTRGPQRDVFEHRVEAQYTRLCHEVAEEGLHLFGTDDLAGLFLVGPGRLIRAVQARVPHPLSESVVLVDENLGRSAPKQLERRLEPLLGEYERGRQLAAVKVLLQASPSAAITEPDEVLAQLQGGRVHTLVVVQNLELELRRCPRCGLAARSADRVCGICGAGRQRMTLDDLLPQVLASHHVKVEFVGGEAAELLRKTGGLAGWLRPARASAAD